MPVKPFPPLPEQRPPYLFAGPLLMVTGGILLMAVSGSNWGIVIAVLGAVLTWVVTSIESHDFRRRLELHRLEVANWFLENQYGEPSS